VLLFVNGVIRKSKTPANDNIKKIIIATL